MSVETRIPASEDMRQQIRLVKAKEDLHTYEETLKLLVDTYESHS